MPEEKDGSIAPNRNLRARKYVLGHPLESKAQQVEATGLSERTIARARAQLIIEGKIVQVHRTPKPRTPPKLPQVELDLSAGTPGPQKTTKPAVISTPVVPPKVSTADATALDSLVKMIDKIMDSGDDEQVHRLLLKQCLTFAFRPDLHPDTRMSASQMWTKLKDMSKAKDLGPGKPKTRMMAVDRLRQLLIAVGPEIAIDAIHAAFEVQNDQTKTDEAPPADGTAKDVGTTGHEGDRAPVTDMRSINVVVEPRQDGGGEDRNLPGPTEGWPSVPSDPRTPTHQDGSTPWD